MLDARGIYFLVAMIVVVSGVGMFIFQLYFAYFKLDCLLKNLPNSYGVDIRKSMLGRDPMSRVFVSANIAMMLVQYKKSIKNGELDQRDYDAIPANLLLCMKLIYFAALVIGWMLISMFVVGKFLGWL